VSGGKNITLTAGTYYFHQLILSGGSTLTPAGGHLDIYVDDKLDFSGGTVVNTTGIAANVSLMSCGTASTTGWTLSGGSGAYFSVYAPNHDINVSGTGNIYGAVVGASLTSSGGSMIHYDAALTQLASKQIKIIPGSWAELSSF
jgi:hypothetical protein